MADALSVTDGDFRDVVQALIAAAGLGQLRVLRVLSGGANNRVFRVDTSVGQPALLKAYFRHPSDSRDRLQSEFSFALFAWTCGLRALPQPLAADASSGLGLYEFLEGEPMAAGQVTGPLVAQAVEFYRSLNRFRQTPGAARLMVGAEACFSLADHFNVVESRLAQLATVPDRGVVFRDARRFIAGELRETWERVAEIARRRAESLGGLDRPFPAAARRLSPSDFGFHNALRGRDGRVRFFDFEYAGWDDPAKMVCDFFCQPAVPVPFDFFPRVVDDVVGELPEPAACRARIELLLPIYRVKWCCILLNDFLPDGDARRRFARGEEAVPEERKAAQLHKAQRALDAMKASVARREAGP